MQIVLPYLQYSAYAEHIKQDFISSLKKARAEGRIYLHEDENNSTIVIQTEDKVLFDNILRRIETDKTENEHFFKVLNSL
jgi:hypothetical protein